jgi:flagellin-specific chaperone FliS
MANEKGLKGVTNIIDKFTDSLTEEEIGSLFKVLKEDKGQTIANIMPTGMEYMMSALKILQCAQTGQNLDTIDSMFAKMKIITDKFESSNKPNEN